MSAQTYRAVLVANSTFPADGYNLPDLEGPRNDPALLRDALCDPDVGVFAPDNVRLVTERTMSEVLAEAEDLLVSATRRDTLLIYYSGHGLLDQSGELFLCTRDTRADRLRSTAVKASDLRGMMDASAAGVTVVVLDCCHSGRFKGTNIPATLSGRGRFVVTSSRPGELANDADARNHASLFTHHLAEGIMSGAVDHDGDGVVTLSELYDYVRRALADEGRQVPQKRFEGDGDVALARRAAQQAPADLVDPAARPHRSSTCRRPRSTWGRSVAMSTFRPSASPSSTAGAERSSGRPNRVPAGWNRSPRATPWSSTSIPTRGPTGPTSTCVTPATR